LKQMKDLKRFSKEWWNNYWFYYKWHTIAGLFVLALIIGTIVDVVTRINPDIDIMVASQYVFADEHVEEIKAKISEIIEDTNNDGRKTVQMSLLNTSTEPKDEMQIASQQKLYLEFAAGDSFIFFMDRELYEVYNGDDLFIELKDGQSFVYAKEIFDFMTDDMVMCVRVQRTKEKADYENTQRVIDAFIGD